MTTKRLSPSASTTSLRMVHPASGLFDTGTAGKVGFLPVTMDTPDVLKAIDASTLFSKPAVDDAMSISLDGTGLETLGNGVPLVKTLCEDDTFVDSKDFSTSGTEFLEGFCDLSSYLAEDSEPLPDMMEVSCITGSAELDQLLLKRPASVAFPDDEEPPSTSAAVIVNTDHDAYTCNAKRPRLSTTSTDPDSSFDGDDIKQSVKYQERRRKNNIASRRSRETRKQKFQNMEARAAELETMNAKLELQVTELETLTKHMKAILVQALTKKM